MAENKVKILLTLEAYYGGDYGPKTAGGALLAVPKKRKH